MKTQKLFDFTRQLENNLDIMLKISHIPEHKKSDISKKIELLREFHHQFGLDSTFDNVTNNSL